MRRFNPRGTWAWRPAIVVLACLAGCSRIQEPLEPLQPEETFDWVAQPITFSPPPARWERQGDNSGGMLGVRFILRGGVGEVISVVAMRRLAERDRRQAIGRLMTRRDSITRREFLDELSLARPRMEDPISPREASAARAINDAIDRAMNHALAEETALVGPALTSALIAAKSYQPTLDEILPRARLVPEGMQEPERWRLGYERDTMIAGHPAFAGDDTLITPERALLYHEIIWVVNGCGFKATYQGLPKNLGTFHRIVDSITFPQADDDAP